MRVILCISSLLLLTVVSYFPLFPNWSTSPTRNRNFEISATLIGPCRYVFIPIPSLNPPYIFRSSSSCTYCLVASPPPLFLPCLFCCVPATAYGDSLVMVSPLSFHTSSTTPSQLFHTALSSVYHTGPHGHRVITSFPECSSRYVEIFTSPCLCFSQVGTFTVLFPMLYFPYYCCMFQLWCHHNNQ